MQRRQSIHSRLNKVNALMRAGRHSAALALCEQVCAAEDAEADAWLLFTEISKLVSPPGRTVQCYRDAVRRFPHDYRLLSNFGVFLMATLRYADAESLLQRAAALAPGLERPAINLGSCLNAQGRTREALKCYRLALERTGPAPRLYSNYLLARQYLVERDAAENLRAHQAWEERHLESLDLKANRGGRAAGTVESLRIGYVSADFRNHSVARFFLPVLKHHDRKRFEIYCYSGARHPDATTSEIRGLCANWRDVATVDDCELAACIVNDRIDILVDLSGHTAGNRLRVFAAKPAPLQLTWLGYPDTTGLRTVDYRITDAYADPPGFDGHYVERLARLDGCFLCFEPPADSPAPESGPRERHGGVTFGSFNNLAKINAQVLAAWLDILHQSPGAKLYIKNPGLTDPVVRDRLSAWFRSRGIRTERIRLGGVSRTTREHLAEYRNVDIALDTFPYNGTTTTCEALWMGVPVLTLRCSHHAGRVGNSLLSAVGLQDWIVDSRQDYVHRALTMADVHDSSLGQRRALQDRLRHSILCDGRFFTESLEALYRRLWQSLSQPRTEY